MCRMNFIQDAHEKDEKSDQPCVRKMLVSQLGWSSSGHHSLGHLLICSPIFCGGACIEDAAPCAGHICELLFCVCRCCSRCCPSPPLLLGKAGWEGARWVFTFYGMNAQHLVPGCEARNYSSLASSRLEKCNPFSLEANPLNPASLNNMLPSYKISFLSLSLLSWNSLGKRLVLKEVNQIV